MKIRVKWPQIRSAVSDNGAVLHYVETSDAYSLVAVDASLTFCCTLDKHDPDTTYVDEFESSYKAAANGRVSELKDPDGAVIARQRAFASADNMRFRGQGVSGTASKTATTSIDSLISETRFINGLEFIVRNQAFGDSAHFQVVDVDNILGYGAGVVLDQFGTSWFIASDCERQGPYILPYPAQVLGGLYLRIAYTSVGTVSDVDVKINYFLHKKTT